MKVKDLRRALAAVDGEAEIYIRYEADEEGPGFDEVRCVGTDIDGDLIVASCGSRLAEITELLEGDQ